MCPDEGRNQTDASIVRGKSEVNRAPVAVGEAVLALAHSEGTSPINIFIVIPVPREKMCCCCLSHLVWSACYPSKLV